MNCCCRKNLAVLLATLLLGYGNGSPSGMCAETFPAIQSATSQIVAGEVPRPRLAGLLPASEWVVEAPSVQKTEPKTPKEVSGAEPSPSESKYWEFPSYPTPPEQEVELSEPLAFLLPPEPLDTNLPLPGTSAPLLAVERSVEPSIAEQPPIESEPLDCPTAMTGGLTDARLNEQAKSKIRRAYAVANRGAYYAARQELIEVLRMVSHAKDAKLGIPKQTEALAAGLRALEEAEDFVPRGTQLEADMAIHVICASHRTPVARQPGSSDILPQQMMDRYFRYAQLKLASSVSGEPAGSMALHALGKLSSQLGDVEPEKHRLAARHAVAFQQAALLAHGQNHLAAHELAVLLADAGHFAEAEKLLRQVLARDPNAVVLRNLSHVQEKLGLSQQAYANRELASRLAHNGASGTNNNVAWVSPQDFARSSGYVSGMSTAMARPPVVQPTTRQQAPMPPPIRR